MLVITHTKRRINLLATSPQDIAIEDIAHALANQPCHGGRSPRFYSRAERAFRLAAAVPASLRLAALLHEAEIAYMPDDGLDAASREVVRAAIRERFGVTPSDFAQLQASITALRKLELAKLFSADAPATSSRWGLPPMAALLRYLRTFDEACAVRPIPAASGG